MVQTTLAMRPYLSSIVAVDRFAEPGVDQRHRTSLRFERDHSFARDVADRAVENHGHIGAVLEHFRLANRQDQRDAP